VTQKTKPCMFLWCGLSLGLHVLCVASPQGERGGWGERQGMNCNKCVGGVGCDQRAACLCSCTPVGSLVTLVPLCPTPADCVCVFALAPFRFLPPHVLRLTVCRKTPVLLLVARDTPATVRMDLLHSLEGQLPGLFKHLPCTAPELHPPILQVGDMCAPALLRVLLPCYVCSCHPAWHTYSFVVPAGVGQWPECHSPRECWPGGQAAT
jgi:hypothetical protein